jgi:hypothetical protein
VKSVLSCNRHGSACLILPSIMDVSPSSNPLTLLLRRHRYKGNGPRTWRTLYHHTKSLPTKCVVFVRGQYLRLWMHGSGILLLVSLLKAVRRTCKRRCGVYRMLLGCNFLSLTFAIIICATTEGD